MDADPARLAQVFGNLLNNACKFTDEGGHIWLTVEHEGEQAVVRVRDNGIGIAADQLPSLFEMFIAGRYVAGAIARRSGHRPDAGEDAGRDARRNG